MLDNPEIAQPIEESTRQPTDCPDPLTSELQPGSERRDCLFHPLSLVEVQSVFHQVRLERGHKGGRRKGHEYIHECSGRGLTMMGGWELVMASHRTETEEDVGVVSTTPPGGRGAARERGVGVMGSHHMQELPLTTDQQMSVLRGDVAIAIVGSAEIPPCILSLYHVKLQGPVPIKHLEWNRDNTNHSVAIVLSTITFHKT